MNFAVATVYGVAIVNGANQSPSRVVRRFLTDS